MSSYAAIHAAAFAVILAHSTIVSVQGQGTIEGCDGGDTQMCNVAEIQQLSVEEFRQLNKQVQSIRDLLNESFLQKKSQQDSVNLSPQAVDKLQNVCTFNASFQELKSEHRTILTSLQAIDQRSREHDIESRGIQNSHRLLSESIQQMRGQLDSVVASFQELKSEHRTILTSLQVIDQRSREHDIESRGVQNNHRLLSESIQQMRGQLGSVVTSIQAVDRRLQEHDIAIRNQRQNASKLAYVVCGSTTEVCDCSDLKASGQIASGIYEVCAGTRCGRVCSKAFCNMDAANGPALVFQRRKDGSVNFYRTWAEYKEGFGDLNGEFWLGNEMLYLLTSKRNYKLRIDLEDFEGNKRYAEYRRFAIGSSVSNYTLEVDGYAGNAGDSMRLHNKQQFSTKDVDNDKSNSTSCAVSYRGAWWYESCYYSNLNGIYHRGNYSGSAKSGEGVVWQHWLGPLYSLKSTEMKLVSVT